MPRATTRLALMAALLLLTACASDRDRRETVSSAITMDCGLQPITLEPRDGGLRVRVGADSHDMVATVSASGARYQVADDESTWLWNKGDRATLMIAGQPWPECLAPGALESPFQARGNEPFWHLTADNGLLSMTRLGGEPLASLPYQLTPAAGGAARLQGYGDGNGDGPTVVVEPRPCRDTMTGMPYPHTVTVELGGERLMGCGGSPQRLLQGAPWQVVSLEGGTVEPSHRLSIQFHEGGRVAGIAACNQFTGEYRLDGESLGMGRVATTRMACDGVLMDLENRFLALLAQVQRFDTDGAGELSLLGADGELLKGQLVRP